jgi:hypothetical protein
MRSLQHFLRAGFVACFFGLGCGAGSNPADEPCTHYGGDGCKPGTWQSCGEDADGLEAQCLVVEGEHCVTQWDPTGCDTPLVLSFDGEPVEYLTDRDHTFDLNGTRSQITDWPTARTPWLALDRDGSGSIDDGSELFGSMTVLSSGQRAKNGFDALRELDSDGDGRITPADPGFAQLLVWADRDGDRRSSAGEVASAASWALLSIDLRYTSEPHCDHRGNCEVESASFQWRDAAGVERTGAVVDVHLAAHR